jgi:hypothetical protein
MAFSDNISTPYSSFGMTYASYIFIAAEGLIPEKKIPILNKTRAITKSTLKWTLGESEICPTNQAVYLGIIRSEMKENEINIEDRISLARRTMYTLMNTVPMAPMESIPRQQ